MKWFSCFFSVEAPKKLPVQQIKEKYARCTMYISPYCRQAPVLPNFIKFCIRGQLADVITYVKFLVNRFRGYRVLIPQNCHFPSTCCVAVTTAYRKTLDRSRAPDRRRAPHIGRGSDSLVPIEAGPRLQAGSRIQAYKLVKYGC